MVSALPTQRVKRSILPYTTNITESPNIPWQLVGQADKQLLPELEQIYWDGVKSELEGILTTLKRWRQPEYSAILLADEMDGFVHGFDTFIDQVSLDSRAFANRYSKYTSFINII